MPPLKKSIKDIPILGGGGGGEQSSSSHQPHFNGWRTSSLYQSLEEHWHIPHKERKSFSFSKLSFKSLMSYSMKLRDSFKRIDRSKSMEIIMEGSHNPNDEELVESLRRILLLEGHLPEKHNDYHTLLRFLRVKAFDPQKAKEIYLKMLKWREDYRVDAITKEFKFEEYKEVKRCYPHGFHGVDRYGRPVYIERIGMVDLNALLQVTTVDRFVKYHVIEQEKTLTLRYPACSMAVKKHVASTTSILDVMGVGMNNFSKPARELFTEIQKIDSNYYPETLHRLYIVNAGSGFRVLWKALKAFMDQRTIAKIQVLGGNYHNNLMEVIDLSTLPSFLGGNCTCSESGGCLLSDKGPWNDPEITEQLHVMCNMEPRLNSEVNSITASGDTLAPHMGIFQNMREREHGNEEQHRETKSVDEIALQKIQVVEAGLQDNRMVLEGLLIKQEKLMKLTQELKELVCTRDLSDKKLTTGN